MPLAPQPATDLRSAYRICDLLPLVGEDLRYYVELSHIRQSKSVNKVNTILDIQTAGEFATILFTGHRGCGKSTELHNFQRSWEKSYRTIYMEVDEETDINDVTFTDLYLLTAKYIEFAFRKDGIEADKRIVRDFENWFVDVTKETENTVNQSINVEAEASLQGKVPFLAKLLVKLIAQIKAGSQDKTTIRKILERDFSQLKANINSLLDDYQTKCLKNNPDFKGILLIFDNLDRCSPKIAESLFFDYAAQLQELHCSVLYTVPIAALYSQRGIGNNFTQPYIVPMAGIYADNSLSLPNPLPLKQTALEELIEVLKKRIEIDLVFASNDELLRLAAASGGHIRNLMQMTREACLTAMGSQRDRIEATDVTAAINQLQFSFERLIPDEHYPSLAKIYRDRKVSNDNRGQMMLYNTFVLEYNGNTRWNYPHPLVINIDAFQRAVKELNNIGTGTI